MGRSNILVRRRHGTAYVFVLGAAALATTAGVTAVAMHGVRLQRVDLTRQGQRASLDAQSTLEYVVNVLDKDPLGKTWRVAPIYAVSNQVWLGDGASRVDVVLSDPVDNDLSNNESDRVEASVRVTMGPVSQAYTMSVTPVREALDGLNYAIVAKGAVATTGSGVIHTNGPISQNEAGDRDWAYTSTVAEGLASSTTATVTEPESSPGGGTTQGGGAKKSSAKTSSTTSTSGESALNPIATSMPAIVEPTPPPVTIPEDAIIDSYITRGTLIRISDITGSQNISGLVLGPGRNPFGATNAAGIYVLDCENRSVVIQNSRILGTLVAINPSSTGIAIRGHTCLQTASESQPALLVRGNAVIDLTAGDFTESLLNINMNPPGVPDRGVTDADTLDSYPRHILGVVFVTGNVNVTGVSTVQGSIMAGGSVTVSGELRVIHEKPLDLIEGMANVKGMRMQPGSFTRVVQ